MPQSLSLAARRHSAPKIRKDDRAEYIFSISLGTTKYVLQQFHPENRTKNISIARDSANSFSLCSKY
jgi:hypothetical protein